MPRRATSATNAAAGAPRHAAVAVGAATAVGEALTVRLRLRPLRVVLQTPPGGLGASRFQEGLQQPRGCAALCRAARGPSTSRPGVGLHPRGHGGARKAGCAGFQDHPWLDGWRELQEALRSWLRKARKASRSLLRVSRRPGRAPSCPPWGCRRDVSVVLRGQPAGRLGGGREARHPHQDLGLSGAFGHV